MHCTQGAECYDNSNGAAYVLINDALPPITEQSTALKRRATSKSAAAAAAGREKAAATKQQQQPLKADVSELEALFDRADKESWGEAEWVAASSSKSDVSKWRRLITWPFGDEGGTFKFNKAGDGLYIVSSIGRWVWLSCWWREVGV